MTRICINDGWKFTKEGKAEQVDLPHTVRRRNFSDSRCLFLRDSF